MTSLKRFLIVCLALVMLLALAALAGCKSGDGGSGDPDSEENIPDVVVPADQQDDGGAADDAS